MKTPQNTRWLAVAIVVVGGLGFVWSADRAQPHTPRVIGPTAEVVETNSGAVYVARVDTGAAVTSLHCTDEDVIIPDESADPFENVGKSVRIRLCGVGDDPQWVETELIDYVEVRSANGAEHRYRIRLPLSHGGVCKETIVNLNDRSSMTYRMLLGRDFLAGDFLVDVARKGT